MEEKRGMSEVNCVFWQTKCKARLGGCWCGVFLGWNRGMPGERGGGRKLLLLTLSFFSMNQ